MPPPSSASRKVVSIAVKWFWGSSGHWSANWLGGSTTATVATIGLSGSPNLTGAPTSSALISLKSLLHHRIIWSDCVTARHTRSRGALIQMLRSTEICFTVPAL